MYIVMEAQTSEAGVTGNIVTTYSTKEQALSKYYSILSAAAVSNVYIHTAFLFSDTGYEMDSRCFIHGEVEE